MGAGRDLRSERSAIPRVFGVISMVLSLPFLLLLLFSSLSSDNWVGYGHAAVREVRGPLGVSYQLEVNGRQLKAERKQAESALFVGKLIRTLFGALSLLLFVAAIGQLKYKAWGRTLSLTWAFLALCYILLLLVMLLPELSLRIQDVADRALGGDFHAARAMTQVPGLLIALLAGVLALYPVLTLLAFVLPHTKASMR